MISGPVLRLCSLRLRASASENRHTATGAHAPIYNSGLMELADLAATRFEQGYSCAQAVFSVLAERRGVPTELALRISAGLGGGIARTAQTCGCLTGAIMAMGLDQASVAPATLCRDLLGCDIGTPEGMAEAREKQLFQQRCARFVRDTVELVENGVARQPTR